jgi:hypothetical protein
MQQKKKLLRQSKITVYNLHKVPASPLTGGKNRAAMSVLQKASRFFLGYLLNTLFSLENKKVVNHLEISY